MLIYTMLSGCVPLRTRRVSDCTASSPDRALEEKGFCDRWLVFSLQSHVSASPDAASLRNELVVTLLPLLCCRMAEGFWNRRLVFFLQSHISSTPDAALLRNDVIAILPPLCCRMAACVSRHPLPCWPKQNGKGAGAPLHRSVLKASCSSLAEQGRSIRCPARRKELNAPPPRRASLISPRWLKESSYSFIEQ